MLFSFLAYCACGARDIGSAWGWKQWFLGLTEHGAILFSAGRGVKWRVYQICRSERRQWREGFGPAPLVPICGKSVLVISPRGGRVDRMRSLILTAAVLLGLSGALLAQTKNSSSSTKSGYTTTEFRDATGRSTGSATTYVSPSGARSTTFRDSSGRTTGYGSSSSQGSSSYSSTQYRDATGRSKGSATTYTSPSGAKSTTYRDSSGRTAGYSSTSGQGGSGYSSTQFREATGRSKGSATTYTSPSGAKSTTFRDSSGRTTGSASTR